MKTKSKIKKDKYKRKRKQNLVSLITILTICFSI